MNDNEKKKSVLILGCGLLQKPSFIAARELNLKIFAVDMNKNALLVPMADEFAQIDLKDKEGILHWAEYLKKNENLQGVFTAGTDFSSSVSYVSEKLGFHAHSFNASMNASDKKLMRKCFKDAHVPCPDFYSVTSLEEAKSLSQKIDFPFVVKPCDNMGARGCRLVRNAEEAESAFICAFENSKSHSIMIEEYMEGPEFSIDALVYKGSLTITGFADRHIYYEPYFIETGHTMPSVIDQKKKMELIECFARGIKALGLTEGAAKADIKYTKKGAEIGEIAARLSGGYMSGWTFPYSSDFFLTKEGMKIALGMEADELLRKRIKLSQEEARDAARDKTSSPFEIFEIPSVKVSAERAWISIPGTISNILELDLSDSKLQKNIKDIFPRGYKEGSQVDFPRNNVQKCGNVISLSQNYPEAVKAAEDKAASIVIRLCPDNKKTDDFLNQKEEFSEKGFPPSSFSFYDEIKEKINECKDFFIKENTSPLENAPDFIKEALKSSEKGFNYKNAAREVEIFDLICPNHPEIDGKKFWKALFRAGLQGALYVSDCAENSIKNKKE